MGAFLGKVFGVLLGIVAAVALVSGPKDAANIAGHGFGVIGMTSGAMIGSINDGVSGFKAARQASAGGGGGSSSFFSNPPARRGGGGNGRTGRAPRRSNGVAGAGARR